MSDAVQMRSLANANISTDPSDGYGETSEQARRRRELRLVRHAAAGDREAFGELYEDHFPTIYRLARYLGAGDPDDVVSEVFVRAWRSIGSYEERGAPFSAWLYAIARHVAVDDSRRRARTELRDELPERAVADTDVELIDLHRAIAALAPEQRRVIEMKYLLGFTNAEVGASMGISAGAVNARQWRALRALAERLGER